MSLVEAHKAEKEASAWGLMGGAGLRHGEGGPCDREEGPGGGGEPGCHCLLSASLGGLTAWNAVEDMRVALPLLGIDIDALMHPRESLLESMDRLHRGIGPSP